MFKQFIAWLLLNILVSCSQPLPLKTVQRVGDRCMAWNPIPINHLFATIHQPDDIRDAISTTFEVDQEDIRMGELVESGWYFANWEKEYEGLGMVTYQFQLEVNAIPDISFVNIEESPINLSAIYRCLGYPDFYAERNYIFMQDAFPGLADWYILFYEESEVLIELIKPQGTPVSDITTPLNFVKMTIFSQDGTITDIVENPQAFRRIPLDEANIRAWEETLE